MRLRAPDGGCSAAARQLWLPDVLREFTVCFPEHYVSLEVVDSPVSLERLQAHEIDIALKLGPQIRLRADVVPIYFLPRYNSLHNFR